MRDLLVLRVVWEVLRSGIRVRTIAPALRFVQRGHGFPPIEELNEAAVWTDGRQVVLLLGESAQHVPGSRSAVTYVIDVSSAAQRVGCWLEKNATTTH